MINYPKGTGASGRFVDCIQMHNHPSINVTFSTEDIESACRFGLYEIRAVCPDITFVMRSGKDAWTMEYHANVMKPAYIKAIENVNKSNLMDLEKVQDYDDRVWAEFARILGITYFSYRR